MKKMRVVALMVAALMVLAMSCALGEGSLENWQVAGYDHKPSWDEVNPWARFELNLEPPEGYVYGYTPAAPKLGDSSASIGSLIALSALTLTGVIVAEKKRRA